MFNRSLLILRYISSQNNLSKIHLLQCSNNFRRYSSNDSKKKLGYIGSKYKIFEKHDTEVILDANEEQFQTSTVTQPVFQETDDEFEGINLKRGIHGVYDIEDLVDVLRRENVQNMFVCKVPREFTYVDYLVAVNGKSKRHMMAIAEFVRRIYKKKRTSTDTIPRIEGKDSDQWLALDLGNIALHIFSSKTRKLYDIDSLWALGYEFDPECNKPLDPFLEMLENNELYLQKLEPKQVNK